MQIFITLFEHIANMWTKRSDNADLAHQGSSAAKNKYNSFSASQLPMGYISIVLDILGTHFRTSYEHVNFPVIITEQIFHA